MKTVLLFLILLWTSVAHGAFDLDACNSHWFSAHEFDRLLSVELAARPAIDKDVLHVSVSQCTQDRVVVTTSYVKLTLKEEVSLVDTPSENKLRTVVLACAELLFEIEQMANVDGRIDSADNTDSVDDIERGDEKNTALFVPLRGAGTTDTQKTTIVTADSLPQKEKPSATTPVDAKPTNAPEKRFSGSEQQVSHSVPIKTIFVGAGLSAMVFPEQSTFVPELRLSLRIQRFISGCFLYGRSWSDSLGKITAAATGGFVGINFWKTKGRMTLGADALAELGAVVSAGHALEGAVDSKQTNLALGGRTNIWLRSGQRRVQFEAVLSAGWLRGLKAWSAQNKLGGFHGVLLSMGLGIVW